LSALNVAFDLILVMGASWHVVIVPQQRWGTVGMRNVQSVNMNFQLDNLVLRHSNMVDELLKFLF